MGVIVGVGVNKCGEWVGGYPFRCTQGLEDVWWDEQLVRLPDKEVHLLAWAVSRCGCVNVYLTTWQICTHLHLVG